MRQAFFSSTLAVLFLTAAACSSSSSDDSAGGGSGGSNNGGDQGSAGSSGGNSNAGGAAGSAGGSNAGGDAAGGSAAGGDAAGGSAAGGAAAGGSAGSNAGGSAGSDAGGSAGNSSYGTAMSFFVSSTPPSGSGDLGGLAGADAHCQMLAEAANAMRPNWVAYLSVSDGGNGQPVHAKDRIGNGPWYNADEDVFAEDQDALHDLPDPSENRPQYIAAKPADRLFMDEDGESVPGNQHDILTGTNADGTLNATGTCNDWTSDGQGQRTVGHTDTPGNPGFSPSWNAAHTSGGCSPQQIRGTGGNGRIYCFSPD